MEAAGRRYIWHSSRQDIFKLWDLSDLHWMAKGCAESEIKRDVQAIANDPGSFWFGGGDYCLPPNAEVLTIDGFVPITAIQSGAKVLAYKDGETFWDVAVGVYATPNQPFIRMHSQTFDVTCTPGHEWLCTDIHVSRRKKPKGDTAGYWKVATRDLKTHHKIIVAARCHESGLIDISDDEAWLLGWLATDGYVSIRSENSFTAGIVQAKAGNIAEIRQRLSSWFTSEYDNDGCITFNICVQNIRKLFDRVGIKPECFRDYYPGLAAKLSESARTSMLDAMLKAEGWIEKRWRWAQKPGPVLDAFQILASMNGHRVGLGTMAAHGVYTTSLMSRQMVTVADLKREDMPAGEAWCIRTTSGSFVVRLGNQITITGNCDFIGYRDKRFDPDAVAEWVPLAKLADLGKYGMEQVRDIFKPIRHKCLGLLIGNHEKKYELATEHESMHHWLCQELNVPYLGYCCLFDVIFCRTTHKGQPELRQDRPPARATTSQRFRVFAHHGAGYATTPGGKLNRLVQFMQSFDADLYFCGHVHDHVARKEPALGVDEEAKKIVQRERLGVVAGSYLKTYMQGSISYGEMKGYRPTSLGPAVAVINPETREFHAEI